ncbi:MAG: 3-deoxy-manno-octulosonate cytidylyltransferase [Halieaceae bacterium]|jgi:3-deoxy-manno-octulosonate cytidylyltransferase (CMP-KDO synthetase)|nr:3-deoxy-manno-octulosonate cytidylyltransferase [Halieaceae bacterium]
MNFIVVIPARYASSRLPGKPLLDIAGKAMLQRVWERASATEAERVVVATDDERIEVAARSFGAEVLMTAAAHPSGTDRIAEVVEKLAVDDSAIIVNVQGDEPLIPPEVIRQVADNLAAHPQAAIATLCERIDRESSLRDPNVVKVVRDRQGMALYFSRACIPWPRDHDWGGTMPPGDWWRHIGLYAYRAGFLRRYTRWSPAPIEGSESLEQLRALYEGERIHVAEAVAAVPGGVDTPDDLEALRALVASDDG